MKRLLLFFTVLTSITLVLGYLVFSSTPSFILSPEDEIYRQKLVKISSRPLGDGLLVDPVSGLPFDNGYVKENDTVEGLGRYTSPTNIGLYLTYLLGIYQGKIEPFYAFPKEKALERIEQILETLDGLSAENKWEGLYYWMVEKDGKWVRAADGKGNYVISQPDNGNLFAGLISILGVAELALKDETLAGSEEEQLQMIQKTVKKLILAANWKKLLDPERELYYLAYIPDKSEPLRFGEEHTAGSKGAPIYVENLMDEWRLGVLIAYALSDLPGSKTQGIPLTSWTQLDREKRAYDAGDGKKIEALGSGHGGMFQQRLPLIFVPELRWSKVFNDDHDHFFFIAANYAQKMKQPFLLSASSNPQGFVEYISLSDNPRTPVDTTYDEFGVKPLALKLKEEFHVVAYEKGRPVGDITPFYYASTPHALALGFLTHPTETIALFKKAELRSKIFVFPGGLPDAYGTKEGAPDQVSFRTLVLDQLMLVLALQGDAFQADFEAGLKVLGVYEKAKKLYADEETFYPKLYPLSDEKVPVIDLDYSYYAGVGQRDYPTAIKVVRDLAIENGFMILSEESERMLAEKYSGKQIGKKDLRGFFQGNLAALSYGENGTFRPKRNENLLELPKVRGWIGDRLPLLDLGHAKALILDIKPVRKSASFFIEMKGRQGEDFFPGKKYEVNIPRGVERVMIPLPDNRPQYLAYLVFSDPTQAVSITDLRVQT